ncbi:hypothetical protein QBC32DRAFT_342051 [Pseudoneurospora amorphoporcata]|uniref:Transmembrane protein n=1 Tax=Pseudoneurospora amorphoporcata TaxID=241081 RepID=A0AAN6NUJ9_9PEZI|nr:hypothetical protein QBC32DRAFT_342051 [Pseudoneurospora amorphoporcata]
MGLTTRYLGRITGSGLLSTISVCVVGWTGCVGCVHVYTNDGHLRAAMGKRERRRKEFLRFNILVSSGITCRVLFLSYLSLFYLSFSLTARMRLSLSLSLSLSRVSLCVYLSVINL